MPNFKLVYMTQDAYESRRRIRDPIIEEDLGGVSTVQNDRNLFASITGIRAQSMYGLHAVYEYPTRWGTCWVPLQIDSAHACVPTAAYWYQRVLESRDSLPNRVTLAPDNMEGRIPDQDSRLASDSVNKKVYPQLGLVVVKKRNHKDYVNEASAHNAIYSRQLTSIPTKAKETIPYFSFQKPLTDEESSDLDAKNISNVRWGEKKSFFGGTTVLTNNVSSNKVRRYSVYGGTERAGAGDLDTANSKNMSLKEYLALLLANKDQRSAKQQGDIANLWSCFHQVIKIHLELYLKKVTHGDMHTGNIKVILVNDTGRIVPICKAFDFGHFKAGSNYTRTDLRYLISKKAVPRFMGISKIETDKRADRWARESTAGVPRRDRVDWKHYPLHRLLESVLEISGVITHGSMLMTTANERVWDTKIDEVISAAGVPFLEVLNTTRGGRDEGSRNLSINVAFEMFANLCVEEFYRKFPQVRV